MIDFHVHIGALWRARNREYYDLTAQQLVERMAYRNAERVLGVAEEQ